MVVDCLDLNNEELSFLFDYLIIYCTIQIEQVPFPRTITVLDARYDAQE